MSNLLPPEQKSIITRLHKKRFVTVVLLFVFSTLFVGALCLIPSLYLARLHEADLADTYTTLAGHETSTIKMSLSHSISDINSRLAVFPTTEPVSPILGDFINPVLGAKTAQIHMTNFSYTLALDGERAAFTISGVADDRASLLVFIDKLKSIKGFFDVDVPISSFIKDTNMPFTATGTTVLTQQSL